MGQKQTKKKTESSPRPAPKPGSEEWWWMKAEENLSPITSVDEFCMRFHASPDQYKKIEDFFNSVTEDCPRDKEGRRCLSYEQWMKAIPELAHVEGMVKRIFDAFDTDRNNVLTLDEFLVYQGINEFGSLEQRVMGSFALYDTDRNHKIDRDELKGMIETVFAVVNSHLPKEKRLPTEEIVPTVIHQFFEIVDTDHNGTVELGEVIKAARTNPDIAKMFDAV